MSTAATVATRCPAGAACPVDPAKLSLTGVEFGQAVVAIVAVLAISTEYTTGMIRSTLTAMPRRAAVLAAKAAVTTGPVLAAAAVAVAGSLLAGRLILPGHGFTAARGFPLLSLADGPVLRAAAGSVLYLALIALFSLGVATAVREPAVAIGTVLGLLYLFPIVAAVAASPDWQRHLEQIGPMTAPRPAPPPVPGGGEAPAVPGAIAGDLATARRPEPWLARRLFPLLATAVLIAIAIASTTWWGPLITGAHSWPLPDDLWATLAGAQRLVHLDIAGLYAPSTGLVSFPGADLILVPVVAVMDAAGISLQVPGVHHPHPAAWLVAGPYAIALSAVALFAADAIAERLGATRPQRALLAAASATALWCASVEWGHPEDAVAVGLLLYGILALSQARTGRSAWLVGAAVAVQPLVLVALPILLVIIEPRRLAGFLARAATPGVVLLGAAAAANWSATIHAVTNQPNWPTVDHPTPWTSLAPRLGHGAVAAGPGRVLAIVVACGCAIIVGQRWRAVRAAPWSPETLEQVLWWTAAVLALRSVFESVMVAYYLWPVLAVALIAAVRSWPRLAATSVAAVTITFVSQVSWRGPWAWWAPMVAGLLLILFLARLPMRRRTLPDVPGQVRNG